MKALIISTGYLRLDGIHVRFVPEFAEVTIEDKLRTAIKLVVEPEHLRGTSAIAGTMGENEVRTPITLDVVPEGSLHVSEAS